MWWREFPSRWGRPVRLLAVLAAASFAASCWEPLYGTRPALNSESVQDKFAAVEIPPIEAPKGSPAERIAVGMFNALQFDLHNGAGASASGASPLYRLDVQVGTSQFTAYVDPKTGRPSTQVETVIAHYQLVEIATGKTVVKDTAHAQAGYDIPGTQQRFAGQRALRNAEDRAIELAADAVRNRLASYFVAGT